MTLLILNLQLRHCLHEVVYCYLVQYFVGGLVVLCFTDYIWVQLCSPFLLLKAAVCTDKIALGYQCGPILRQVNNALLRD